MQIYARNPIDGGKMRAQITGNPNTENAPMTKFAVTYEIVTPESAEIGDIEERGYVCEDVTLREAVEQVYETRTCQVGGIESIEIDEWPMRAPRWVTINNSMEYLTGAHESRSLHLPETVSSASRRRIAKLLGAK